jgi:hypothetical protein
MNVVKRRIGGVLVEHTVNGINQLPAGYVPKIPVGLGDKIASIATPIARALKMPCIDPKTGKLRPTSGCAKMKARLNAGMPLKNAMILRIRDEINKPKNDNDEMDE